MEFAPPARSCHVTKWPEFQGYGFTLHHNKKLDVQEIGAWRLNLSTIREVFTMLGEVPY